MYLTSFPANTPILVEDDEIIHNSTVEMIESDDIVSGQVSKIDNQSVTSFENFLRKFKEIFVDNGKEFLCLTMINNKGKFHTRQRYDLSSLGGVAPSVDFFDKRKRAWVKMSLEQYIEKYCSSEADITT